VDALMMALKTTFDAAASDGMRALLELRLGVERFRIHIVRRQLELSRGPCEKYDAAITTDATSLRQLCFARRELARAERAGEVQLEGDKAVAARFFTLFRRPAPVESRSSKR
jgi:ubiquinone biosynthesis protein UbiJ